jgi:hypothetical protein
MKNNERIAGALIIILLSVGLNLNAQRGMRGFRNDSLYMKHDSTGMRMQRNRMAMMNQMGPAHGGQGMMGRGMGMRPMMQGSTPGWMAPGMGMHGMMHGGGRMAYGMMGPRMGWRGPGMMAYNNHRQGMMRPNPGMRLFENIPGLSEKQKEEIAKLNKEQQNAMQKLRESQQKSMQELRDAHRKKIMNTLTDEQKKWMQENAPANMSK